MAKIIIICINIQGHNRLPFFTFLSLSKHKANTTELTQSKANLFMLILKQGYIGIERYHAETQQRTK